MPIDTRIEGDPESIRSTAAWLRSGLQTAVHDCGTRVYHARTDAEGGWRGPASTAFQDRMSAGGRGIDSLDADVGRLSASFDRYADGLQTAQAGMRRAKDIALHAGLAVTGDVIEDPGPAPAEPPADGALTPGALARYATAAGDHRRKVAAFGEAAAEAERATGILADTRRAAERIWADLIGKKYVHATEFTNGVAAELVGLQRSLLKDGAAVLRSEVAKYDDNYLHSPGGSEQARFNERLRFESTMKASELDGEVDRLTRLAGKFPVIGIGIAGAGVGWDIAHGKPPGKAIFSGAIGTAGAFGAEALAGSAMEALGAGAVIGAVTPVGAAVIAGVGVGVLADYAWDHWVPDGVKDKIESGLRTAGHDIASVAKGAADDVVGAAKSVGHFFSSVF